MTDILQDTTVPSLIAAIEQNLHGTLASFGQWPLVHVHDDPEILWSISDIPFPVFNGVMRAWLPPERVDPLIDSLLAQARARRVPLMWWTGPGTRPEDLGERLKARGFVWEGPLPGMAVELGHLKQGPAAPQGLTVERVTSAEGIREWTQACALGFGLPDFVRDAFGEMMSHADPSATQAYVARLDGQAVASSLMLLAAGVAGIYNVATVPAARRKGIGAAVTLAPLLQAREQGYKVGILHSSEMGASVYKSLGFREYCQLSQWLWEPGE